MRSRLLSLAGFQSSTRFQEYGSLDENGPQRLLFESWIPKLVELFRKIRIYGLKVCYCGWAVRFPLRSLSLLLIDDDINSQLLGSLLPWPH